MIRASLPPLAVIGLAAFGILDAGLGFAAWKALAQPAAQDVPAAPAWHPPGLDGGDEAFPARDNSFAQTLDRPVFSKTRRPPRVALAAPAPATAAPAPAVGPDPGFVLTGVMILGRQRRAFMTSRAEPLGIWAAQDGVIEGWSVAAVEPQTVTLVSGPRRLELQLYRDHP